MKNRGERGRLEPLYRCGQSWHDLCRYWPPESSRPIGSGRGSCCVVVAQPIQFELARDSCAGRVRRFEFLESARRVQQLDTVDSTRQSESCARLGVVPGIGNSGGEEKTHRNRGVSSQFRPPDARSRVQISVQKYLFAIKSQYRGGKETPIWVSAFGVAAAGTSRKSQANGGEQQTAGYSTHHQ
jgi:hypothetical protein